MSLHEDRIADVATCRDRLQKAHEASQTASTELERELAQEVLDAERARLIRAEERLKQAEAAEEQARVESAKAAESRAITVMLDPAIEVCLEMLPLQRQFAELQAKLTKAWGPYYAAAETDIAAHSVSSMLPQPRPHRPATMGELYQRVAANEQQEAERLKAKQETERLRAKAKQEAERSKAKSTKEAES